MHQTKSLLTFGDIPKRRLNGSGDKFQSLPSQMCLALCLG